MQVWIRNKTQQKHKIMWGTWTRMICKKCGHGMILHGCVEGIGYCSEGNGDWCNCDVKGLTYDEEIKALD